MTLPADAHPLTLDQIEEGHALIIGQTRSGKTYLARAAIEQLYCAGRRIGAIDKLGNHWGLTLDRDGQGPGLDFVIFGGKRAMVPMTPDQGGKLGRLFVERNIPAIFDVSQWHAADQQRWVADFCDSVFRYNEGALHLALDEAQSWVPLNGGGPAFQAVLRLAEQGLGNGIHLLMTVQRLSRLDATVRSMARIVVVMRQTGTIDRTAVTELVSSSSEQAAVLKRDLSGLPVGTGYIWDPGSDTLARVAFPPNETFDSSRTPRHGDTPPPAIAASSALVDELRAALAPPPLVESDKEKSEPTIANGESVNRDEQIVALEAANLSLVRSNAECADLITEQLDTIARHEARLLAIDEALGGWRDETIDCTAEPDTAEADSPSDDDTDIEAILAAARSPKGYRIKAVSVGKPRPAATDASSLVSTDREYRALAGLVDVYPSGLTEAAWAARTGYKRKGGAWTARRKRYADAGMIEQRPDPKGGARWFATELGRVQAGAENLDMPKPGPALVAWWAGRLGAAGRLLKILADVHPRALTRDVLAAEARMTKSGGAFSAHIGTLKAAELIVEHGKRLSVAPALVGDA